MKITVTQLRKIIREEVENAVDEDTYEDDKASMVPISREDYGMIYRKFKDKLSVYESHTDMDSDSMYTLWGMDGSPVISSRKLDGEFTYMGDPWFLS